MGKRKRSHYGIPEDVMFREILSKLPVKSLMRFKCVSKSWLNRITSDSQFIATHLDHQSKTNQLCAVVTIGEKHDINLCLLSKESNVVDIDFSYLIKDNCSVDLVGSCNGLLCIQVLLPNDEIDIMLWNPATREMRCLPRILIDESASCNVNVGFEFDEHSENNYKVVIMVGHLRGQKLAHYRVQVFTKSSNSWGGLQDLQGYEVKERPAVALDGALYWTAYGNASNLSHVLWFDLRDEVLQAADAPLSYKGDRFDFDLTKWNGSLAALIYAHNDKCYFCSMSITKINNEKYFSWTRLFKIIHAESLHSGPNLFCGVWRDQFLLLKASRDNGFKLCLFDPRIGHTERSDATKRYTFKKLIKRESIGLEPRDYVQSLVSVF